MEQKYKSIGHLLCLGLLISSFVKYLFNDASKITPLFVEALSGF